jgi:hypothetical protein
MEDYVVKKNGQQERSHVFRTEQVSRLWPHQCSRHFHHLADVIHTMVRILSEKSISTLGHPLFKLAQHSFHRRAYGSIFFPDIRQPTRNHIRFPPSISRPRQVGQLGRRRARGVAFSSSSSMWLNVVMFPNALYHALAHPTAGFSLVMGQVGQKQPFPWPKTA